MPSDRSSPHDADAALAEPVDEPATDLGRPRTLQDEQAQKDRRLAQSDTLFRLLVESVSDYAIFMLDRLGRVSTWNAGAERIKGYRADEIIGRHFCTFYPADDVAAGRCEAALEAAARDGRHAAEGWRVRKDGTRFWASVVITAVRDDHGELIGFGKVTRDLTDRMRAEQESAARMAAEQASKTKDQFLAMLGHELRNPLAPIVSAIQLLKLRGDPRSVREHQVIERQVNQMIRLVDDLLDVSRVSRGKIVLARKRMDLRDALARAAEIAIPSFDKLGQHFAVHVPPRPLLVDGDDARLVQVFTNLLDNASKYTPAGGHIALSVRHAGRNVLVEVRDDGAGIEPALLPRIFELFVQGYQDVDRASGGLGLGLMLVRYLVEQHGGSVEVHSRGRGLGSTFLVRLPALEAAAAADDAAEVVEAGGYRPASTSAHHAPVAALSSLRRVLVVDDNEDARMLLAEMLTTLGHDVRSAGDGPSALALLDDFRPHIAILDIGLPGMDGHELAQRIRRLPWSDSVRVVALSGYGQPADRARAEETGFDVYLVKPVDLPRLLQEIGASGPSS